MTFKETLLSWNNVKISDIIILIFIISFMYLYIFKILNLTPMKPFSEFHDNVCLINCEKEICRYLTKNCRGSNYLLGSTIQPEMCIFTMWENTHFLFYIFIGYFYNLYIGLGLSVIVEIWEHYVYDCGSLLDIFWNTLGLFLGIYIRYHVKK